MKYSSADDINFHSQLPFNVASDEIFIFFLARDSIRQWDDAISEELTVAVCRPAGNVKLFDFHFHFIFKKVQCQRTEKMENKYEMDRFSVVVLLSFIHSGMSSSIVAFSSFYSKLFFLRLKLFCLCMYGRRTFHSSAKIFRQNDEAKFLPRRDKIVKFSPHWIYIFAGELKKFSFSFFCDSRFALSPFRCSWLFRDVECWRRCQPHDISPTASKLHQFYSQEIEKKLIFNFNMFYSTP